MGIGLKGFISKKLNKNYFIKEKILGAVQDLPVLYSTANIANFHPNCI